MFEVYARYLVAVADCPTGVRKDLGPGDLKTKRILIYDDTSLDESLVLIEPKLDLEDSTAGKFEFTMPIANIGYGYQPQL